MEAHIALVTQSGRLDLPDLMRIAAAAQKQVQRDLAGLWQVSASVDAFATLSDVPTDYWRVVIRDDIGLSNAVGAHWTHDGQPFALVRTASDINRVCQAVSHEVLEMLIDPNGSRLVAGASPLDPLDRVNFILEICDPTQASVYAVNGLAVCDFVTPAYFGPVTADGARYSYNGRPWSSRAARERTQDW